MKVVVVLLAAFALVLPAAANADSAQVALSQAQELGTVESSSVETSTLERAEGTPGVTAGPEGVGQRPVQVYTFTGKFVGKGFSRPAGSPIPTGHRLRLVLDEATGRLLERELSDPGATATTAKARVAKARHRVRAHAAWNGGTGCQYNAEEGKYHCYDLAEWFMEGSEKVKGTELQDETTWMSVPEGGKGWIVNNEEWAGFPEKTDYLGDYWIENGVKAGAFNEASLYWFVAWNNGAYGEQFGWPEEGWRYINFSMQANGTGGEWCSWIDGNLAHCVTGLAQYSHQLQVGSEYVTPWTPVDNYNEQTNYTVASGSTRKPWNKVSRFLQTAETFRAGCSRESPPHYYPGNYSFWVPEWAHNAGC